VATLTTNVPGTVRRRLLTEKLAYDYGMHEASHRFDTLPAISGRTPHHDSRQPAVDHHVALKDIETPSLLTLVDLFLMLIVVIGVSSPLRPSDSRGPGIDASVGFPDVVSLCWN
jgi:hypothetical protein